MNCKFAFKRNVHILWGLFAGLLFLGMVGCASDKSLKENQLIETNQVASSESSGSSSEAIAQVADESASGEIFDPFEDADTEKIEEYDPWEPFNVAMFDFNYNFDKYFLKPVAQGYNYVIPDDIQQSIFNAFQNVRFVPRFLNNIFQTKFKGAGIEASRFLINSTLGVGGLFDPATYMFNLETPPEDAGQTLGVYGTKPGPYLVMPFLGPFTLRDGAGYVVDIFLDPFNWLVLPIIEFDGIPAATKDDLTISLGQLGYRSTYLLNLRSLNLERFQGVEEGTLDLYGAVRNAYLQNRAQAIKE